MTNDPRLNLCYRACIFTGFGKQSGMSGIPSNTPASDSSIKNTDPFKEDVVNELVGLGFARENVRYCILFQICSEAEMKKYITLSRRKAFLLPENLILSSDSCLTSEKPCTCYCPVHLFIRKRIAQMSPFPLEITLSNSDFLFNCF